jgi:peptidyl-tRNA hydrolase
MAHNHDDSSLALLKAFVAGALLPSTLACYLYFARRVEKNGANDDGDDSSVDAMPATAAPTGVDCRQWGMGHAPYKMVLCVNTSLTKMGRGKMAAQCCHAAVGCYRRAAASCPAAVRAWERTGAAKIAVRCPTTEELELLSVRAGERGVPCYLVEDAGRTQIEAGSRTVLGLFGPASVFEGLTDHLKLL